MPNDSDPVTIGTLTTTLEKFFVEKLSFLEKLVEENNKLQEKVEELNKKVESMEMSLDDQAAYSRRNNIVIHGIPMQENGNELAIAKMAGDIVGVRLKDEDIDAAHRLQSTERNKNAPPFIIKLVNRFKKTEMIKQARAKKPTAEKYEGAPQYKIFYTDHLTRRNQEILFQAKRLGDKYYVWTKNGMVMRRERDSEGARTIRIKSVEEVDQLGIKTSQPIGGNEVLKDAAGKRGIDQMSPEENSNAGKRSYVPNRNHGLDKFRYNGGK